MTAVSESDAAVIYTDVDPDFTGGVGDDYYIDLNNDGVNDFRIWHNGSSNLYISPLNSNNYVLGSGSSYSFAYPYALSNGAMISSGQSSWFNTAYYSYGYQSMNYGSCSYGHWCSVTDKYLGVQFTAGGNQHFGWIRLDVNASGSNWVVKDYAFQDTPNASLLAGEMPQIVSASVASNITGTDVSDNSNGEDLSVSFDAAPDESTLSEYRIMAVKTSNISAFGVSQASALTASEYISINPNASPSYTTNFLGVNDSDGDPIAIGINYTLFVLSMADGSNATVNAIDSSSVSVMLNTSADVASNVSGSDIGNNGNGSDLEITFDAAQDESTVDRYRIMVVKETNATSFDLTAAQAVTTLNYTTVVPNGNSNYSKILTAIAKDVDGDLIAENVNYQAFILSTSNGSSSTNDSLSDPSTTFVLLDSNSVGINENLLNESNFIVNENGVTVNLPKEINTNNIIIRILTIDGKLIRQENINQTSYFISTNGLSRGIYLIQLLDVETQNMVTTKVQF